MRDAYDLLSAGQRGHPAAARRAVVEVLLGGLVAPVAEAQGLDRPWQVGLRRSEGEHLPHDFERLARVMVRVDLAGFGRQQQLATRGRSAQSVQLALGHSRAM